MIAGDTVLLPMPAGPGASKVRPGVVLTILPGPFQDLLVCGISTQLHQLEPNWDELIQQSDPDFATSGLLHDSIIRLSYLRAASPAEVLKVIGQIDPARLARLRQRLSDHLRP